MIKILRSKNGASPDPLGSLMDGKLDSQSKTDLIVTKETTEMITKVNLLLETMIPTLILKMDQTTVT